ncbi:MAG: hypothetical protein IT271_04520 [Chitinophagales bacterium]|nr:hypothetical protein [Chitinophagales bacterium]
MKKLFYFILANMLCAVTLAQQPCKSDDELKVLPTKSKLSTVKAITTANKEQMALVKKVFTTTVEPAFAATKGMAGNWSCVDYINSGNHLTSEKLIKYELASGLNLLQCKNGKVKEVFTPSIQALFGFNFFISEYIAYKCEHDETKVIGKESKTVSVNDTYNNQQIYYLQAGTTFGEHGKYIYYRQIDNKIYFILCKPDVPIFIPLTVKQVLEICKKNQLQTIEDTKAGLVFTKPETRADYEKRMSDEFAAYRKNFPDAEKIITDMIKQLEDIKVGQKQQIQTQVDLYTKWVKNIDAYLNTASAKELNKEYYGPGGLTAAVFETMDDVRRYVSADKSTYGNYFVFNPAYFNRTISNKVPQFITIELDMQLPSPLAAQAFKDFEKNLDLEKLKSFLAK